MQKLIISHCCGGLGNQMFQYAAGRALALRFGCPLCLDVSWFHRLKPGDTMREFLLLGFPGVAKAVSCIRGRKALGWADDAMRLFRRVSQTLHLSRLLGRHEVREPHFAYWPGIESVIPPARLEGFWQSEKYFHSAAAAIRADFAFPPLPSRPAQELAARIRSCPDAVSLHIRRGDYVNNPHTRAFHGMSGKEYYAAALERIRAAAGTTTVFLFSDEPQWVREHFDCQGHAPVVAELGLPDAPQHDMHLMSLCRHHIIANSSFSWWGAWLGDGQGITIAPRRWFADPSIDTSDVCPSSWILL
ncbi:MAG: alpha-1,2-fucosyltransferase [Desulfovibrio desulfuricans]|jgi:hypothetical protein|nr:alpha-1,2-fucosyltransferase [Desulfovibrio desulfuricans]